MKKRACLLVLLFIFVPLRSDSPQGTEIDSDCFKEGIAEIDAMRGKLNTLKRLLTIGWCNTGWRKEYDLIKKEALRRYVSARDKESGGKENIDAMQDHNKSVKDCEFLLELDTKTPGKNCVLILKDVGRDKRNKQSLLLQRIGGKQRRGYILMENQKEMSWRQWWKHTVKFWDDGSNYFAVSSDEIKQARKQMRRVS